MKDYHSPQPKEGINTSKSHPLKTFIKLFAAIAIILVAVAWVLGQSGSWLASRIPYQQEVVISERYISAKKVAEEAAQLDNSATEYAEIQHYLETLVRQLEDEMHLPEGMHIQVHYEPEDVENAFATLGGHIFMYKGLLAKLPNENSLAMLLAHEMSHVKLRHPIRAAGQNLAISSGVKLLLGYSNMDLLGNAGLYTQLNFSRRMESAADKEGLKAVYETYGTVAGAVALFETLHQVQIDRGKDSVTPFFSTHPLDDKRINDLNKMAKNNNWINQLEITPFPENYRDWL